MITAMSPNGATESDNPRKLSFGRYVLDLGRGSLLSDGREIALRPKTFAVLTYLAQRPGQFVSRQELFDAVWPGLIVTDETLAQSITELRRALGDAESSLITTMARRGYRLDAAAAPSERRHQPGIKKAFRWRWVYGLIAPLLLFIVFLTIWLVTSSAN